MGGGGGKMNRKREGAVESGLLKKECAQGSQ